MVFLSAFRSVLGQTTFTENFDGCNRAALVTQCWQFASVDVSSTDRIGTTGCSARSSALSNPALDQYAMRTPPLRISGSSTITFAARAINLTSTPTLRITAINLITGVRTDLITYSGSSTPVLNTTLRTYTLNTSLLPGDYRIQFAPSGNGGTSRVVIDDIGITNVLEVAAPPTCSLTPLPVTLASFSATQDAACRVRLVWETSQEINNQGFAVERSADVEVFQTLGQVAGRGTTREPQRYEFTDANPLPVNYYRLKQIDFDGKSERSKVVALVSRCPDSGVSIQYEPAQRRIQIQAVSQEAMVPLLIQLTDLSGRIHGSSRVSEALKTVSFSTAALTGQVVLLNITDAGGRLLRTHKLLLTE